MSEWNDLMRGVAMLPVSGPKVTILTGSLVTFTESLQRTVGLRSEDRRTGISSATFMGLPVIEDERVPGDRAVLKRGEEVIAIVRLA